MSTARAALPSRRFVRLAHLRKLSECEQVAAVCYRVRNGEIELLLIRTSGGDRWTFPKGSAEAGLTHAQAAALEAFEEAGVHGRIEEAAFARYFRRAVPHRSDQRGSTSREPAINAHLCQVLRLSSPKESKRNRTWFSIEEARRRLREGRDRADGAEFVRVIDRAVARIWQGAHAIRTPEIRLAQSVPPLAGNPTETLQKVKFDFAEICRSEAFRIPHGAAQSDGRQRFTPSPAREAVPCEVLEFVPPREAGRRLLPVDKKSKALAAAVRNC